MDTEQLSEFKAMQTREDETRQHRNDVLKSLSKTLDEIDKEINNIREEQEAYAKNLIDQYGLEGFMNDPEFTAIAYSAMWSGGVGSPVLSAAWEQITEEIPYLLNHKNGYVLRDNDNEMFIVALEVCIPKGAEKAKLTELAEKLEKLYKVQLEVIKNINADASSVGIKFFTDDPDNTSSTYSVQYDDSTSEYVVYELSREILRKKFSVKTMLEVITWASQHCTYGATKEYKARNTD